MQNAIKHSAPQRAVVGQQGARTVSGPVPIAPELLQFIGGGKGTPPPPKPTAPNNGW